MFTICVEAGFRARHHVRFLDGATESPHEHDWRVRVFLSSATLDAAGMVADFDMVRGRLLETLQPLDETDLNVHPMLGHENPTAEVVAKRIFDRLYASGLTQIQSIEVTEAPGCVAIHEPDDLRSRNRRS